MTIVDDITYKTYNELLSIAHLLTVEEAGYLMSVLQGELRERLWEAVRRASHVQ